MMRRMVLDFYLVLVVICAILGLSRGKRAYDMIKVPFSLRQSLNIAALKAIKSILLNPQLCIPKISLEQLKELDLSHLEKLGTKAIIFDKDNTLR